MGRIWSDENKYRCWLKVEAAASQALARFGLVPQEAADAIRDKGDFTVERTSVDFQLLAGEWSATPAARGWSGGKSLESSDAGAAVRWMPVVPEAGVYRVEIWRPAGSAAARAVVRHAGGDAVVRIDATDAVRGRWLDLGAFRFQGGAGAELTLSAVAPAASAGMPARATLRVDAIRFVK